ncbi:MAG: HI0074 family nucleotidyltransferase substrate-binding subunit [Armatimonadetes bacterium]|nr:HI0074 family nucleotidyltransferase substrate-binding subunit [Armatimonadota bacterium]
MPLVLSNLGNAVQSLERALQQPLDEFSRDSAILRFGYTYELAWKLLRRVLLHEFGRTDIDGAPRRELFRAAAQHGLIPDPAPWFDFHDARNRASHTYNEVMADEVYRVAADFLPAAEALLAALEPFGA